MYKLMLKEFRKEMGLRQEDVANAMNVTLKVYGGWERGDTALPLDAACELAAFLGCTVDELAGGKRSESNLTDMEKRVIAALRSEPKKRADYPIPEEGIA